MSFRLCAYLLLLPLSANGTETIDLTLLIRLLSPHSISSSPPHLHAPTLTPFHALQANDLCYAVFLVWRKISAGLRLEFEGVALRDDVSAGSGTSMWNKTHLCDGQLEGQVSNWLGGGVAYPTADEKLVAFTDNAKDSLNGGVGDGDLRWLGWLRQRGREFPFIVCGGSSGSCAIATATHAE
jgi:hypothetical protein